MHAYYTRIRARYFQPLSLKKWQKQQRNKKENKKKHTPTTKFFLLKILGVCTTQSRTEEDPLPLPKNA